MGTERGEMAARKTYRMAMAAAVVLATGFFGTAVHATSFDCKKGHSANEKMICSDPELSAADDRLGAIYKRAKRAAPNAKAFRDENESQWEWRENNCHDKACLVGWYQMRTRQLERFVSADTNRSPDAASVPDAQPASIDARSPSSAAAPTPGPAARVSASPAAASAQQPGADAVPIMVYRSAQAPDVTAQQLYQDYKRNAAAADGMYKGKTLRFTGTILRVSQDPFHPFSVEFATGDAFDTVDAHWTEDTAPAPGELHVGSTVTLNCRGDGVVMGSPSLRCR